MSERKHSNWEHLSLPVLLLVSVHFSTQWFMRDKDQPSDIE